MHHLVFWPHHARAHSTAALGRGPIRKDPANASPTPAQDEEEEAVDPSEPARILAAIKKKDYIRRASEQHTHP